MLMMKRSRVWLTTYAQIDLKYATIEILDGTATPNSIEIKIGEGNFNYTEAKNIDYTLDRGVLDDVREGDQIPINVSTVFTWEYLKGATGSGVPTVEDALKKRGEAAAWVSTDADACRPYAVDLRINYAPQPSTCGDREVILLPDFRVENFDHDLRAGTVTFSGKCNVTDATITRSNQSS